MSTISGLKENLKKRGLRLKHGYTVVKRKTKAKKVKHDKYGRIKR